jgi:hypothetical protein
MINGAECDHQFDDLSRNPCHPKHRAITYGALIPGRKNLIRRTFDYFYQSGFRARPPDICTAE